MSNNKKAFKSGIWYTIANFITRSIGLLTTPFFARVLTKAEFGGYSNYASWVIILSIFVTLNLESTFISARHDFEDSFDEYVFSCLSLSFLSGLIWFGAANLFQSRISSFLNLDPVYMNCIFVYLLCLPAINLYQTRERFLFEYKKTVLISLLVSLGTALLSVILVMLFQNKLTGRIIGNTLPTVFVGLVLFVLIATKGKKVRIAYWKYALPICLPFIPHLLSLNLLNQVDRIMINSIRGEEENALYSMAYTCGSLITLLITSLNGAFAPWLSEKLAEENHQEIMDFSKPYIATVAFFSLGVMLLSPEILHIMGGEKYREAVYVMPPVTVGCFCQFLYIMHVNVEQFKKKTVGMALASISAAGLNYLLNLWLIPRFGYIAAAYTTLVGYLWLALSHMVLVHRLGYAKLYPRRILFATLIVLLVLSVLISFAYSVPVVRYFLIAGYIGFALWFLVKYRQKVVTFIRFVVK